MGSASGSRRACADGGWAELAQPAGDAIGAIGEVAQALVRAVGSGPGGNGLLGAERGDGEAPLRIEGRGGGPLGDPGGSTRLLGSLQRRLADRPPPPPPTRAR